MVENLKSESTNPLGTHFGILMPLTKRAPWPKKSKVLSDIILMHLNVLPAAAADVLEAVLAFLAGGVATVSGSSSSLTTITSSDSARDGGRPRPMVELSHLSDYFLISQNGPLPLPVLEDLKGRPRFFG